MRRERPPAHLMRTYGIASPGRPATCAEYGCDAYRFGWQTIVPADSPQADYIRKLSGRAYTEERDGSGLAVFTFEPGQQGFAGDAHDHRVPIEDRERFMERPGDIGRPAGEIRVHANADDWVDSFANNMIRVQELAERG